MKLEISRDLDVARKKFTRIDAAIIVGLIEAEASSQ